MILIIKYTIATGTHAKKIIDGTKAYVRGAKIIDFKGICPIFNLIVGNIYFPNMVKNNPRTICNDPTTQKIGPKNVNGFFEKKFL